MQKDYTFIIPHRNLPAYMLRRCLDSIPHWDNVEIIVVDDNSDTKIVDFENFPGMNEQCTEVLFDKTGKGPGYSRNLALDLAKGKWIFFADADDYFITENLVLLMKYCMSASEDLICYANEKYTIQGERKYESFGYQITNGFNVVEVKDRHIFYEDCHQSWKRVVKRTLVKNCNARFKEIRYCEDLHFVIRITENAENISMCTLPIYTYIKQENSVTVKRAFSDLIDAMNESILINKHYKKKGIKERLTVRIHLLLLLYKEDKFAFIRMIVKELIHLGVKESCHDYKYVCRHYGMNPNVFVASVDCVRVKLGGIVRNIKK